MRTKKQVTARMTDRFAKDLNLVMLCTNTDSATTALQDAVHSMAEYYRHRMARRAQALPQESAAIQQGVAARTAALQEG